MDESGKEISGTRTTGLLKCPIAGLGYLYISLCFPDNYTAGFVVDLLPTLGRVKFDHR